MSNQTLLSVGTIVLFSFSQPALAAQVADASNEGAWKTTQLDESFTCEGASFGDLNLDNAVDLVIGPWWYEGPTWELRHELYTPKAFDVNGYSDHFFSWTYDVDADGWLDIVVVGFPHQAAEWFQNPGVGRIHEHWQRHLIAPRIDNESPAFKDVNGDGRPDLVFGDEGFVGWAAFDPENPQEPWAFHRITPKGPWHKFTHGLGVGDIDGDGRADVLLREGWWGQPESLEGDPQWNFHSASFSQGQGGAQMLVFDVDGDGDNDVVSSLNAHKYGLSWFENSEKGTHFQEHGIWTDDGVALEGDLNVSELHALALVDINEDGLMDVVTGKRTWSHGTNEKGATDPGYIVWFELVREEGTARFVTHVIHDDSGVGTQVSVGDANGDGMPDIVVGNKKGGFVHVRQTGAIAIETAERALREASSLKGLDEPAAADEQEPKQALDDRLAGGYLPLGPDGEALNLDFESGTLEDWTATGDAFTGQPIQGDSVNARRPDMTSDHVGDFWIGGYELLQDAPKGTLTSAAFELDAPWASFWIAGGVSEHERVEIVRASDSEVLVNTSGRSNETLRPMRFDLSEHLGSTIFVRLVDESDGGWGHLNFDHFRLHKDRPEFKYGVEEPVVMDRNEHAGLAPEEAARAMTVPAGFHVDVVAAEPDVHQPVALAIDERGRVWVAEAHSYPSKREAGEGQDKIVIFEDADGDGSFETRKEFITGLNLVSGFEVGFGGVWIGQAPELLFVPDRNRDDVPDSEPVVLLDGWGYEDTHETLNAFNWGPDGWLYGCHGVFTHSKVGKPGCSDEERTPLNAGVWRYHPIRHEFEVFAWGTSNPWGVDFDAHGQAFATACVIPHLFHMIQGGRYIRQGGSHFNPHAYYEIDTIADHRHFVGGNPHGGNGRSGEVGGGHAHCGALLYLGDEFPEQYHGSLLFNNVHGNRVNQDVFERNGSGFIGKHADDFLLSHDSWFRGINLQLSPDGSVYFIDWSDPRACHSNDIDNWDRSSGRIYRVRYGEEVPHPAIDLAAVSDFELVATQAGADEATARLARRVMAERGGSRAIRRGLYELLVGAGDSAHRLRALWGLHVIGELEEGTLAAQLQSRDEYIRAWSVQLLLEDGVPSQAILDQLTHMAQTDPSAVVRLYLASALQRMPVDRRWSIAEALAGRSEDASDHNIPNVLWYAIEPLVGADPARAIAITDASEIESLRASVWRRAASEDASRAAAITALTTLSMDGERRLALDGMWRALEDRRGLAMPDTWGAAYEQLKLSSDDHIRFRALGISALFGHQAAFPELRELLSDSSVAVEHRRLALDSLVAGKDDGVATILQGLLDEEALRSESIRALAQLDDAGTPKALLAKYAVLSEDDRANTISALSTRASFARELLEAVGRGDVTRTDLTAVTLRQLRAFEDEGIDTQIEQVWGLFRETDESRAADIAKWMEALDDETLGAADLSRGRDVYARTCMRCHTLYGEGALVGPDLTGSNRSDLSYILTNILDPSAVVPLEYRATIVRTHDERILTGILSAETDDSITLKTEYDEVVVDREEIDAIRLDENSMMPEGQLATLTEQEVADLVAYLRHDSQVPRMLTPETVNAFFDGETLTGWHGDSELWSVEEGAIVGRTEGLEQNAWLASDVAMRDFRLILEVKLDPNSENSGVQFRAWGSPDHIS
ncbi:MAG: putative membrane-bound dehydrogenase-like protein, partial [Planctomycetota bacterium]